MIPARFHVHDDERQWPGEDDVHGRVIGPRYNTFDKEPGLAYVAFGDRRPDLDAQLTQPNAILMANFGSFLANDRLPYEFKIANGSHFVYNALPEEPDGETTAVLWWKRPIATKRLMETPHEFPWLIGDEMFLIERDSRQFGFIGTVLSVSGGPRASTGYVAIAVEHASQTSDIVRDLNRAFLP